MHESSTKPVRIHLVVLAAIATCAFLASVPASAGKQPLPEVDDDGLHLVPDAKVAVAYARPGTNLATYTKLMILDCFVDFHEDWQRDYNMERIGLSGRVTDKDAETIRKRLSAQFKKVFTEELGKQGHAVVDTAGPDVLMLRPALLDVVVVAPDVMQARTQRILVDSAGAMTLYMELYDSASGTLLARVADPQADDNAFVKAATRTSNRVAADRILRSWAGLLAGHLGEIRDGANAE